MATQKRRIIYMEDGEWERLTLRAAERGVTISSYVRGLVALDVIDQVSAAVGIKGTTQAERDAILRKVNRGK